MKTLQMCKANINTIHKWDYLHVCMIWCDMNIKWKAFSLLLTFQMLSFQCQQWLSSGVGPLELPDSKVQAVFIY